jgi:hypothetical protein
MSPAAWKTLDDLGLLSAVGVVVTALVLGGGKLIRTQWAAHLLRKERISAHLEATYVLLDAALKATTGDTIEVIRKRAALQQRLREARERLDKCVKPGNSRPTSGSFRPPSEG